MITQQILAELLRACDVKQVSADSGVSTKTIYRLRSGTYSPTLRTVTALVEALKRKKQ